jgi:hypothetical protein
MHTRLSHLAEGPHLETSTPEHDPAHPQKMQELQAYAQTLYAQLVEFARDGYAPTQDGRFRDLFEASSSRVTKDYVAGTPSPEQIANKAFNLLIKIREHQGSYVLVVAPTATTNERNVLRAATQDLSRGGGKPTVGLVYHWLSTPAPGEASRAQVELA